MAQTVKNPPAMQETLGQEDPWVGKIPWRREWLPTPLFFPGESQGQRSLAATVHGVAESETTKRLSGASLVTQGKELACNAEDLGSIPGSGRSPGGEHGSPPQYSCLENSMDRGDWRATVRGVTKSWTRPSDQHTHTQATKHESEKESNLPNITRLVNSQISEQKSLSRV